MFCWNALAGDLTEKQKKIFRENKFYHGYTIPEPKEMVRKLMQQLTFSSTRSVFSWLQLYNFQCCRREVEPRSISVNIMWCSCAAVYVEDVSTVLKQFDFVSGPFRIQIQATKHSYEFYEGM